jgi:hypothetical protein
MARARTDDEAAIGKLRNREKLFEIQWRTDMAAVMDTAAGRRFMYKLVFGICGLMDVYRALDAGVHRHEGARAVGITLAEELQRDHTDSYVLMINEQLQDAKRERALREAAQIKGDNDNG